MTQIIATWICIDDKTNGTHFPSAQGNSSELHIQQIYWRCICTFFWSARFHNLNARLVLFSNQAVLPTVDDTEVGALLNSLGVQFYVTPFEYATPPGYYGEWRNQFYEFSIFKFVVNHADFKPDDLFILLDSDCIITKDLAPVFKSIEENACITYQVSYEVNAKINGNSRTDMKAIFGEMMGVTLSHYPVYHGGEFFAASVKMMNVLMNDFYIAWEQLIERNAQGKIKLNEEAHVLSYLFYKNGINGGQANAFIKRLWTDPSRYRNVELRDVHLAIWHLPAEKRKGFKKFFQWLQAQQFRLSGIGEHEFRQQVQDKFMVPVVPLTQKPYYAAKTIVQKLLKPSA